MARCPHAIVRPVLLLLVVLGGLIFTRGAIYADPTRRIEIPSAPNPVGSGARAVGMGGAFIAVADDATAASWNPGGLTQLERPELSLVVYGFNRREANHFDNHPEAEGTESVSRFDLNYLSAAYPFHLFGVNMIASLNYQRLYDFSRKWDLTLLQETPGISQRQHMAFRQTGDLSAVGLAYAIEVRPGISFGATLNYWGNRLTGNGWEQELRQTGNGTFSGDAGEFELDRYDEYKFSGFNMNLGVLWRIREKLTLGGTFKGPFKADIDHCWRTNTTFVFPDAPELNQNSRTQACEDARLRMPMSYGVGAAYRFSDAFTLSLDMHRTHWNDFEYEDNNGNRSSPITGHPSSDSDIDPTVSVRAGAEYLFIFNKWAVPLRGGLFYDPAPAEGHPDDFYGASFGTGLSGARFSLDAAYQFRFGNQVAEAIMPGFDFSQNVREHSLFFSVILYL